MAVQHASHADEAQRGGNGTCAYDRVEVRVFEAVPQCQTSVNNFQGDAQQVERRHGEEYEYGVLLVRLPRRPNARADAARTDRGGLSGAVLIAEFFCSHSSRIAAGHWRAALAH